MNPFAITYRSLVSVSIFVALSTLVPLEARAEKRIGFVAGNNNGLAHEGELLYAQEDVRRVGEALVETGAVSKQRLHVSVGEDLSVLKKKLAAAVGAASAEDSVVIFLSSHGDKRGLHIDGEVWPWAELKRLVEGISAGTVVVFVDACMSGSILSPKGFVTVPRRKVKATAIGPKGKVIIASSGAQELSHESTLLRSSPFANSLISGLRGGADDNGDDRITIGELYTYIFGHAAADTVSAPGGPQRAVRDIRIKGAGDLVVARPRKDLPRLHLGRAALGRCFVLDEEEREIMAELSAEPTAAVALPKGVYVVRCLNGSDVSGARIAMSGEDVYLSESALEPLRARQASLAKGPPSEFFYYFSANGGFVSSKDRAGGMAGVSLGLGPAGGGLELSTRGLWTRSDASLVVTLDLFADLSWWSVLGSRLDLGIAGGLELGDSSSSEYEINAVAGPFARLKLGISADSFVVFGVTGLTVFYKDGDERIGFTLLATAGLSLRIERKSSGKR